jgi:hypothetical protein
MTTAAKGSLRVRRILVVEDEHLTATMVVQVLTDEAPGSAGQDAARSWSTAPRRAAGSADMATRELSSMRAGITPAPR